MDEVRGAARVVHRALRAEARPRARARRRPRHRKGRPPRRRSGGAARTAGGPAALETPGARAAALTAQVDRRRAIRARTRVGGGPDRGHAAGRGPARNGAEQPGAPNMKNSSVWRRQEIACAAYIIGYPFLILQLIAFGVFDFMMPIVEVSVFGLMVEPDTRVHHDAVAHPQADPARRARPFGCRICNCGRCCMRRARTRRDVADPTVREGPRAAKAIGPTGPEKQARGQFRLLPGTRCAGRGSAICRFMQRPLPCIFFRLHLRDPSATLAS